jgi:ribosome maturation factor RimP
MDVLDSITALAGRVCETHGLDLVDVEIFRAGRRRMVRVYVGKIDGVSIEHCARVSREISAVVDAENWLGEDNYVLEVSSPGLDRPFKTLADWKRSVGRNVKVTTREKHEGKILHSGKLIAADENEVTLEVTGKTPKEIKEGPKQNVIPMALVAIAKIEIKLS